MLVCVSSDSDQSFRYQVLETVGGQSFEKKNVNVTFNFKKQDVIGSTKFSKLTMCSAYRVFQLDMLHFKRLLGHQESTL